MMGKAELFGFNVYDIFPNYNEVLTLLDADATQQTLMYRATGETTSEANSFLDAVYRPMITFNATDPNQPTYRFVAASTGNECAVQRYGPGKTFINMGAGVQAGLLFYIVPILTYKLAVEAEAYALPPQGSGAKIARLYVGHSLKLFGFIPIVKPMYNKTAYAPGYQLPVDGVPGAGSPVLDFKAIRRLSGIFSFDFDLLVPFPIYGALWGYFGLYAYNQGVALDYTYVSVGSALDVNPLNMGVFYSKYVNGFNQSFPSQSETFIAQESVASQSLYNNVYLRFTARNARWMYNEMEALPNSENCSPECSAANPYYMVGPLYICSGSAQYSIPLNSGASVIWTATPANIVSISNPTSAKTTVARIGEGHVTLTATVTGSCNGNLVLNRQVAVGNPWTCQQVGNGTCTIQVPRCSGQYNAEWGYFLPNPTLAGVAQWKWEASGGKFRNGTNTLYTLPSTDPVYITPDYGSGSCVVFVRPVNACGVVTTTGEPFKFVIINTGQACGYSYMVSPNPASSTISISPSGTQDALVASKRSETAGITHVEVLDKTGTAKRRFTFGAGTKYATIDISALPVDLYIVRLYYGTNSEDHKILITR